MFSVCEIWFGVGISGFLFVADLVCWLDFGRFLGLRLLADLVFVIALLVCLG